MLAHTEHALTFFSACSACFNSDESSSSDASSSIDANKSNSKDDSNNMIAYNNRNANNSRNESKSRTANTVGTSTIAGMMAKVMKPATACREDNNNIDTINMRCQQQH